MKNLPLIIFNVGFIVLLFILMLPIGNICYNRIGAKELLVAKTISAEACSEGALVMFGVGSTIRNRMIQKDLTAYQVITEKNQYYGYTNKNREKIFTDARCNIPAMFIAEHINELPDTVNGAIYFRFKNEPKQKWHRTLTQEIGKAEFYQ